VTVIKFLNILISRYKAKVRRIYIIFSQNSLKLYLFVKIVAPFIPIPGTLKKVDSLLEATTLYSNPGITALTSYPSKLQSLFLKNLDYYNILYLAVF
jgi:hypothetical protein